MTDLNDPDPRSRLAPLDAPSGAFDGVMTTVKRRQRRRLLVLTSAPVVVVLVVLAALTIGTAPKQKLSTRSPEPTESTSTTQQESTTTSPAVTTPGVSAPTTTPTTTQPEVLGNEPLLIGDKDGVYEMNPDGTAKTLLFSDPVGRVSWSRAHDRVALTTPDSQVVVRDIDGSNNHVVATSAAEPTLSPDGTRVAYGCQTAQGEGHLCLVNADGGGTVDLTPNAPAAIDGAWSPDGTQLVYVSQETYQGGSRGLLVVLDLATGQQRTLLTATNLYEFFTTPDWSPDGSTIVYSRKPSNDVVYDLWAVNADGTRPRPVSSGVDALYPHWSPDGAHIAFVGTVNRSPSASIFVIAATGGSFHPIPNTSHSGYFGVDW
jgi:Tol biopolymer transport system component